VLQVLDQAGVSGAGFDTTLLQFTNQGNETSMCGPDFDNLRAKGSHQLHVVKEWKPVHSNNSTTDHRQPGAKELTITQMRSRSLSNETGRRVTMQAKQLEGKQRRTQAGNSKQRNHTIETLKACCHGAARWHEYPRAASPSSRSLSNATGRRVTKQAKQL
jgi:hypothetical protein